MDKEGFPDAGIGGDEDEGFGPKSEVKSLIQE